MDKYIANSPETTNHNCFEYVNKLMPKAWYSVDMLSV